LRIDDRTDCRDRFIEPLRDLAIGGLELARMRRDRVELGCESRAVGIESVNLRGERRMALVLLKLSLDRSLECIERGLQALGRRLEYACISHAPPRPSAHWFALGYKNRLRGKTL